MSDNTKKLEWQKPNGEWIFRERVLNSVGPGWRPMVDQLIEELFDQGWNGDLRQIKEKFGGLRFYIGEANDRCHGLTEFAESLSDHTCEACGQPGARTSVTGWLKTLCVVHAKLAKEDSKAFSKLMNEKSK